MKTRGNTYTNSGAILSGRGQSNDDRSHVYENVTQGSRIHGKPADFPSDRSRCYRLATVCLGLLCVLLLTAVTLLWIKFTAERDQLHTSNTNLTMERDQLQTTCTALTAEIDQLHTSYTNLTMERDQLQTTCTALTAGRDQLHREREECKLVVQMQGWLIHGSSLYYISTEKKRWTESREDCRQRGADLVVINSKEEENFVKTLTRCKTAWIGPAAAGKKDGAWKGVDSTALATGCDWRKDHPTGNGGPACVVTGAGKVRKAASCHRYYYWICEKNIPDWCF